MSAAFTTPVPVTELVPILNLLLKAEFVVPQAISSAILLNSGDCATKIGFVFALATPSKATESKE